jgi:hypothetical protein
MQNEDGAFLAKTDYITTILVSSIILTNDPGRNETSPPLHGSMDDHKVTDNHTCINEQ